MAERAGLDFGGADFDVSGFTPKKTSKPAAPREAVKAVSEDASFQSREPAAAAKTASKPVRRRVWRTGRNVQFATKVTRACSDGFYELADKYNWTLGETLERAQAALRRELGQESPSSAK